ncbi:adenylosuccinate synthetase [Candidatus Gottesmanbacteria bacterium]|nr:adenylosuccinate synthetase [Candidatus Gottesmanbacteria bacterium]
MRASGLLSPEERFLHPDRYIADDIERVYKKNHIAVGWPKGKKKIFHEVLRPHTVCVVGVALGDEGKGRVIDNLIGSLQKTRGITGITVVRFQGGNNSGHTVEANGIHLALHQIPCGVMYKKATCIMDRGMTINPVDLVSEIHYVEELAGKMKGRLYLSQDALLNTDLDRAEELLNRKRQGKAGGGTGRGIGPSYAHHYDRLGLHISDLIESTWKELLGGQYDRYEKEFSLYGIQLSTIEVPDFLRTKKMKKEYKRLVGSKQKFLRRIGRARHELIARKIITNTFVLHKRIYEKKSEAVLFEGAQALGLHPWLGTLPDITASDTSIYGIQTGTAFWKMHTIEDRIGIFKIPYTSSVGARRMPTQADNEWATRVRDEAHEYGTTTGRARDILFPDIPMLSYNIRMSGVEMLIGTHLDVSWENVRIHVCTHYADKKGNVVSYQPGLLYLNNVVPHYVTLPGWDGALVRKAKSFKELPENAKKFLAFLQLRLAMPITAVTVGPSREHYITTRF